MHEIDLTAGAVLETGCVYIVPLLESLKLPDGISASANPKSSTGRLDIFTRVMTDHGQEFDKIAAGYDGPLWPRSARAPSRSSRAPARACRRSGSGRGTLAGR
jgi:deoxycytidine triphosphate deaminase